MTEQTALRIFGVGYKGSQELRNEILTLQQAALDLRKGAADVTAQVHFRFIQENCGSGSEYWIVPPDEAQGQSFGLVWRVVFESCPRRWGYNLAVQEIIMCWFELDLHGSHRRAEARLNPQYSGMPWYASPYYDFNVGFIDGDQKEAPYVGSIWNEFESKTIEMRSQ